MTTNQSMYLEYYYAIVCGCVCASAKVNVYGNKTKWTFE